MFRLLWNVSRPDLAARPARVGLFVVAVCTGVAMMTAMRAATDAVVAGFSSDLEQLGGRADLQITFGTGEAAFPEDTLELLADQPFIAHAAALVRGSLTFADGSGETLELFGVDLLQQDVRDIYDVEVVEREVDDFTIINDPYGVFLTREIASERGLTLGDTVEFSAVNGINAYTVRGILAMHGLAEVYGGRLAAMYLPAAQAVAGKEGSLYASQIDQIDLVLAPSVDLEEAREALAEVLPESLSVSEPLQRKAAGERTVAGLRATLIGMSSFALLAAMFIVYATTAALVKIRLPTMGTLLSIGARPQRLVVMILLEAAVLGFAGAVAGVLIGLLLASLIRGDIAAGMSLNYSLLFSSDAGENVSHAFAFWYPLLGSAAAVCSAWVPARGLLREDPLAIGRRGASSNSGEMPPFGQVLAAGFAVMCLGSLAVAAGVSRQSATLCTVGGIALLLSSIIVAAPAIRVLWDALGPPLTRVFGIGGRIAAESLTRDANRSVVTVTAIALCISVAVGASTLALSFRRSIVHWYGFSGDAVIASRSTKGGWLSAPLSSGLEAQIASLPAAARVEVLRVSQGNLYGDSRIAVVALSDSVAAEAVDAAELDGVLGPREALASFSAGRGVLVSENFAAHFERDPGNAIDLDSPGGRMRLPVLGVVPDFVSDKGSVIMARDLYRDRWQDSLVNYFVVDLAPGFELNDLRRQLGARVPDGSALSVLATSDLVSMVEGFIATAFADMDAIQSLVVLITLAGIIDFLVSSVIERRREFALLRIAGAPSGLLVRSVILESLLLGLVAALLGAAAGAISAWIWVRFNYAVLVGYVLEMNFSWTTAVSCLILTLLTAAVTGGVTAMNAVRKSPLLGVHFD